MVVTYEPLEMDKVCDSYDDVEPVLINESFLREQGIDFEVSSETLSELEKGSEVFQGLLKEKKLQATREYSLEDVPEGMELEIHNYTGMCPSNVFEVNPINGACSISCLYCLVTDGSHLRPIVVYKNYASWLLKELEKYRDERKFFYYSPKTEAFCEPLLESGVAHDILRAFRTHYNHFPDSKVRLFIATKAGPKHLNFKNGGESILGILSDLKGKVQVNGSIGIMPRYLHEVLEPNAPSVKDRLEALRSLQERGVFARSVLLQPIMPYYLSRDVLNRFFDLLKEYNIENVKPEFLTVNMTSIALVAQYIHTHEPENVGRFLRDYISPDNQDHRKQRCRTAPSREECSKYIAEIVRSAEERDISISICNWVRVNVEFDKSVLEMSKNRGYMCLGYQEGLFDGN